MSSGPTWSRRQWLAVLVALGVSLVANGVMLGRLRGQGHAAPQREVPRSAAALPVRAAVAAQDTQVIAPAARRDGESLAEYLGRMNLPGSLVRETIRMKVRREFQRKRLAWMYPEDAPFWRKGIRAYTDADRATALARLDLAYLVRLREELGPHAVDHDDPDRARDWRLRWGARIPIEKYDALVEASERLNIEQLEAQLEQRRFDAEARNEQLVGAILTPQERREYDLRHSRTARGLVAAIGKEDITEDQYRALYGELERTGGAIDPRQLDGVVDGRTLLRVGRRVDGAVAQLATIGSDFGLSEKDVLALWATETERRTAWRLAGAEAASGGAEDGARRAAVDAAALEKARRILPAAAVAVYQRMVVEAGRSGGRP